MHIGLLKESTSLVEFFTSALSLAGHTVRAYPSRDALLASLREDSPTPTPLQYDLLALDSILSETPSEVALLTMPDRTVAELLVMVITGFHTRLIERAEQAFPRAAFLTKTVPLGFPDVQEGDA